MPSMQESLGSIQLLESRGKGDQEFKVFLGYMVSKANLGYMRPCDKQTKQTKVMQFLLCNQKLSLCSETNITNIQRLTESHQTLTKQIHMLSLLSLVL